MFSFCLFEFGRITNILCRRLCNFFSLAFDFLFENFLFFFVFFKVLLLFLAFLWLLVMNHDLFVLFFFAP